MEEEVHGVELGEGGEKAGGLAEEQLQGAAVEPAAVGQQEVAEIGHLHEEVRNVHKSQGAFIDRASIKISEDANKVAIDQFQIARYIRLVSLA